MIFANATISTTRAGVPILTNRRVQWEVPTLRERMDAVGAIYDVRLFDDVDGNYRQGDIVTLVSLDDFARTLRPLPDVTKYRVNLPWQRGGALPVWEVELAGVTQ